MKFRVAIVGGGPAGLATLYELLHTTLRGRSTVRPSNWVSSGRSIARARFQGAFNGIGEHSSQESPFSVTLFEQNKDLGGVWLYDEKSDSVKFEDKYYDPQELSGKNSWAKSALYPDLYTNTPEKLMKFSYMPEDNLKSPYYPYIAHRQVLERLQQMAKRDRLYSHIEFSSRVNSITKKQGDWNLKVNGIDRKFDAVVLASGRQNIPHVPYIKGLQEFCKKYPETVIHSKSFRDPKAYENKDVLIVGSSISSLDIIKFVYRYARSVVLTVRSENPYIEWVNKAAKSPLFRWKFAVEQFLVDETGVDDRSRKAVKFSDDSVETFDNVILATGYHNYIGNLISEAAATVAPEILPSDLPTASNRSQIFGFYLHSFFRKDPSLAIIGQAITPTTFHLYEMNAAAIAGVFYNLSGRSSSFSNNEFNSSVGNLPSTISQLQWERERYKECCANNISFDFYPNTDASWKLVQEFVKLAPQGRPNPFEMRQDLWNEYDSALVVLEDLFFKELCLDENKQKLVDRYYKGS